MTTNTETSIARGPHNGQLSCRLKASLLPANDERAFAFMPGLFYSTINGPIQKNNQTNYRFGTGESLVDANGQTLPCPYRELQKSVSVNRRESTTTVDADSLVLQLGLLARELGRIQSVHREHSVRSRKAGVDARTQTPTHATPHRLPT